MHPYASHPVIVPDVHHPYPTSTGAIIPQELRKYPKQYDVEGQFFYYTEPVHSNYNQKYLKYAAIAALSIVLLAALAAEYYTQQRQLTAAYSNFMLNKPKFCDGNQPASAFDMFKHSLNFDHVQQCNQYHNYKQFGPDSPNPALVISSLFTKVFIIPVREIVLIFQALAYITQVIVICSAIITLFVFFYFFLKYYTISSSLQHLRMDYRQHPFNPVDRYNRCLD
jgi:hypothetical protein